MSKPQWETPEVIVLSKARQAQSGQSNSNRETDFSNPSGIA